MTDGIHGLSCRRALGGVAEAWRRSRAIASAWMTEPAGAACSQPTRSTASRAGWPALPRTRGGFALRGRLAPPRSSAPSRRPARTTRLVAAGEIAMCAESLGAVVGPEQRHSPTSRPCSRRSRTAAPTSMAAANSRKQRPARAPRPPAPRDHRSGAGTSRCRTRSRNPPPNGGSTTGGCASSGAWLPVHERLRHRGAAATWQQWGERVVERLRGMLLAIWDAARDYSSLRVTVSARSRSPA